MDDSLRVGPFNAFLALPAMQLFSYEMADYLAKTWISPETSPRA